jgi:hypothetical protein
MEGYFGPFEHHQQLILIATQPRQQTVQRALSRRNSGTPPDEGWTESTGTSALHLSLYPEGTMFMVRQLSVSLGTALVITSQCIWNRWYRSDARPIG